MTSARGSETRGPSCQRRSGGGPLAFTLALLALTSGCGISARDGQFRCPDGRCPSGLTCTDGLCRVGSIDGGARDGGALDGGALDAGPARDAPGLDAPDAGPAESCAPEAATGVPADEDADGFFDEGCTLYFGPVHPVLAAMPRIANYYGLELVGSGLSGVVVDGSNTPDRPILVARRPNLGAPFTNAVPLTGARDAMLAPVMVTVNATGNEIVVQAGDPGLQMHLYSASGSVAGGTFTDLSRLVALDAHGLNQIHPSLARDGLELYFVSQEADGTLEMHVAHRPAEGSPWSIVTDLGRGTFPRPSEDGRTLYFVDPDTGETRTLERTDRGADFPPASSATPWDPLGASGRMFVPSFHRASREVLFTYTARTPGMPHDDSPLPYAIFRAEVCADGPCTPEAIACADGTSSADGLHCYRAPATASSITWAAAFGACDPFGHMVTLHTAAERALVRTIRLDHWLGMTGTSWVTGEPTIFDAFTPPTPTGTQCSVEASLGWTVRACTSTAATLCEDDLWPAFVP